MRDCSESTDSRKSMWLQHCIDTLVHTIDEERTRLQSQSDIASLCKRQIRAQFSQIASRHLRGGSVGGHSYRLYGLQHCRERIIRVETTSGV